MGVPALLFVVSTSIAAVREPAMTAAAQLARLQEQAREAHTRGDEGKALQVVLEMQKLLNHTSAATEELARAYLRAGERDRALAVLDRLARLGVASHLPLSGDKAAFAALAPLPGYREVVGRLAQNGRATSASETAFTLEDASLLVEDIDYDPRSQSFFLTSVYERKIVRLDTAGKAVDFAKSPSQWPLLAVKVDVKRGRVWATEVALKGFAGVAKDDWGRSGLLCFDLASGRLLRRIEGPTPSALGDMVLDAQGNVIVSDGDGGGIYKAGDEEIVRIDDGDFVSPQTPSLHPDGKHLFVPDYARGIGILDITTGDVAWMDEPRFALDGIDGLYFDRGALLVTQNGTSPQRVARFLLDPALTRIVSQQIIEQATASFGEPTHGVVVGDSFYYIANSGWSWINEQGQPRADVKATPARVMRHRL